MFLVTNDRLWGGGTQRRQGAIFYQQNFPVCQANIHVRTRSDLIYADRRECRDETLHDTKHFLTLGEFLIFIHFFFIFNIFQSNYLFTQLTNTYIKKRKVGNKKNENEKRKINYTNKFY